MTKKYNHSFVLDEDQEKIFKELKAILQSESNIKITLTDVVVIALKELYREKKVY